MHELHYPVLKELGLTETEALIYEVLLEQGPKPAKDLVIPSGLSRGNVYNALTALVKKGLATEKTGVKTVYEAAPPSTLATLLDRERTRLQQISASFQSVLPQLTSEFTFSTGKPVIQMYYGYEGIEEALMDTLATGEEILTYLDIKAMSPEFQKINARYLKARLAKKVLKKLIVEDAPEAKEFFKHQTADYTDIRFVPKFPSGFKTSMQIYANSVLYMTMEQKNQIAVIIRDKNIYDMHRAHFNFLWDYAALRSVDTSGSNAK